VVAASLSAVLVLGFLPLTTPAQQPEPGQPLHGDPHVLEHLDDLLDVRSDLAGQPVDQVEDRVDLGRGEPFDEPVDQRGRPPQRR
jgi:hypothetical protein